MCGIIGFTGSGNALEVLIRGLRRLEYRGYDSAGLALLTRDGISVVKRVGSVEALEREVSSLAGTESSVGIAHTRWATHGGVTDRNAHPHTSCDGRVAIVHNGIIENHEELRAELIARGHRFTSETDSEVIAHLLEEELRARPGDPRGALTSVVRKLRGSFAFVAVSTWTGDAILAARHNSPLVVGVGKDFSIPASDVLSFLEWTDDAIFLENESCAVIRPGRVESWLFTGEELELKVTKVAIEVSEVDKRGYVHHTLKEIHDQRFTVTRTLTEELGPLGEAAKLLREARRILLVAAGTSYHAALVGRYVLAELADLDVQPVLASEYNLVSRWVNGDSVLVAISQSGETADVLEAVRDAKQKGAKVIGIVNMPGSSLERLSDVHINIRAGPEIGVAATKSFTSQVVALIRLASAVSGKEVPLDPEELGAGVEQVLEQEPQIAEIASILKDSKDVYLIGRGVHYPIALEGALKVKELAYVHAEGLPAGELKHGTLALIESGTPVIVLNPSDDTHTDTLSNCQELKARGARLIGISDRHHSVYDFFVRIPRTGSKYASVLLEVIPLQLLAYYMALERGAEIDKPRNLAKSVTVK
ncbi:MAG: glutamine--fructose-6-phosphate transaminase (isomerizing) [Aigarchaeota archaeon]|nr:glutamine--fructose-6-phosphate transaminase (isomerizing) [Candidatus Calditenuis fumarioli]